MSVIDTRKMQKTTAIQRCIHLIGAGSISQKTTLLGEPQSHETRCRMEFLKDVKMSVDAKMKWLKELEDLRAAGALPPVEQQLDMPSLDS